MLLLTGPLGSGKTHHVLEQVREALRRNRADFRLLAPTATMAEHIRNEMAREGFVFRPNLITTLSKFIEPWAGDRPEAPSASVALLVGEALDEFCPEEFQSVASLNGFRVSLARLIEELSSAGCDSVRLENALRGHSCDSPTAAAFLTVFAEMERTLRRRGLALRAERLRQASGRIQSEGLPGINHVYLDGFFSLADPELAVIDALRRSADVTVTLPSWEGAQSAHSALRAMGFPEKRCEQVRPQPQVTVIGARTMGLELDEIARRVVEEAAAGRAFREIGIIVRSKDPYVPALQTILERFGIPARFYFGQPLADHSAVRYLTAAVEAMLGGWEFEATLRVLKMTASGAGTAPVTDQFDFEVRKRLPGQGLPALRELTRHREVRAVLDSLTRLNSWRDATNTPSDWAALVRTLRGLFRPPRPVEPATHEMAAIWRSQAAALDAFDSAVEVTSAALDRERKISFPEFWQEVKTVLWQTTLRVPDRRRNVVHVLDVYEARQWELPVVFVCGLLEKQFPLYHQQDPVLPDDARRSLQGAGIRLRTAAEREREERFLFQLATSRATSKLVLSYPQFNEKGEENLRSFYLDGLPHTEAEKRAIRPQPEGARSLARRPVIYDATLREQLRAQHAVTSPTAVEVFLQCPFQFFGKHTLRLEGRPPKPADRLDATVQGRIVHQALAEWLLERPPVDGLFERVFQSVCERLRVPAGYRTEAVRLEILRNLRRFAEEPSLHESWKNCTEREFNISLEGDFAVQGRIDRIDIAPDGRALVIDYKYSRPDKIRERVKAHENGTQVQGGLYMLAVERALGHEVAGMLFVGFRREVRWDGWHVPVSGLEEKGESRTPEGLRELIERAKQVTMDTIRGIREGRVAPDPTDKTVCEYCDFRDVCRVETAAEAATAGAMQE